MTVPEEILQSADRVRADGDRRDREPADSDSDQRHCLERPASHLAADGDGHAVRLGGADHPAQEAQNGRA